MNRAEIGVDDPLTLTRCWAVGMHQVDEYRQDTGQPIDQTLIEQFNALLEIDFVSRAADRHFRLSGQALPSVAIEIETSPDLIQPFTAIGSTTSDATGAFQFDDAAAVTFSKRFYRATYP